MRAATATGSRARRRPRGRAEQRRHRYSLPRQDVAPPPPNPPDGIQQFQMDRKRLTAEEYHYPDSRSRKDKGFDRRLDVYQRIYEQQEMDGRVRYAFQRELEAQERQIGGLVTRQAQPLRGEVRVTYEQRLLDARAKLLRYYKGVDADLRSGEESRVMRAEKQLRHAEVFGDDSARWDYGDAAARRFQAELSGPPGAAEAEELAAEVEGRPHADAATMATTEIMGFTEGDRFAMLRRELGAELADEVEDNLKKNRKHVVQQRLQHVSDWTKKHQLEKRMVSGEYKAVFNAAHYMREGRMDWAKRQLHDAEENAEQYAAFEAHHGLNAEAGLNDPALDHQAAQRERRAEALREHRAREGVTADTLRARARGTPRWEATAGVVHNPSRFVDADWWELAADDPPARRAYAERLRRDARALRAPPDAVAERQAAADETLAAADTFSDWRRRSFWRGYPGSQVLAYDGAWGEPDNPQFMEAIGRRAGVNRAGKDHRLQQTDRDRLRDTFGHSDGQTAVGPLTWERWDRERGEAQRAPPGTGRRQHALPVA